MYLRAARKGADSGFMGPHPVHRRAAQCFAPSGLSPLFFSLSFGGWKQRQREPERGCARCQTGLIALSDNGASFASKVSHASSQWLSPLLLSLSLAPLV